MKNKKNLLTIIFLIINISILVYLLVSDKQMRTSLTDINRFNIYLLLFAIFAMILYLFIDVVLMKYLIRIFTGVNDYKLSTKVAVMGRYYDAITPFAAGGQPFQIYIMSQKNISVAKGSSVILLKYFIYQMVFCVFGIIAVVTKTSAIIEISPLYYTLALIAILINFLMPMTILCLAISKGALKKIFAFFINLLSKIKIIKNPNKIKESVSNSVSQFSDALRLVKTNKKALIAVTLGTVIQLIFFVSIPYILYMGCSHLLPSGAGISSWADIVFMYLFVYFVMSVFPLPGGSGAAEFGFMWIFAKFFPASALALSVMIWRIITYYFPVLLGFGGVIYDSAKGFRKKKQRSPDNDVQ